MERVMAQLVDIPQENLLETAGLLCRAFQDYPMLAYIFNGPPALDDPAYLEFFHFSSQVRTDLRWPLIGVEQDGVLAAAMGLSLVDEQEWPESLQFARRGFMDRLGPERSDRLAVYGGAAESHRRKEPHYYVGFIGVDPLAQGKGYARLLLDEAHHMSDADASSAGVGLDTNSPKNVEVYEHFGYKVIASSEVGPVPLWSMFRAK
jgi:GNAT superfamily N-acetyltransferase